MEMTRRMVVTGITTVTVGALIGVPTAKPSATAAGPSVSHLVGQWLDVQWTYRCVHRTTFHPGGQYERRTYPDTESAELGPWREARREIGDWTDAVLKATSDNVEDLRLKSAVVGSFWAKEGLPDAFWALPKSAAWIKRLTHEAGIFRAADIRLWQEEFDAALALPSSEFQERLARANGVA